MKEDFIWGGKIRSQQCELYKLGTAVVPINDGLKYVPRGHREIFVLFNNVRQKTYILINTA